MATSVFIALIGASAADAAEMTYVGSDGEIWVAEAGGSNPRPVTTDGCKCYWGPWLSPDGKTVVYYDRHDFWGGTWVPPRNLFIQNIDGGTQRLLYSEPESSSGQSIVSEPVFSPDGRQVLFRRTVRGRTVGNTTYWPQDGYLIDTDGTNLRALIQTPNDAEYRMTYSPDGTKLTWAAESDFGYDLWVANADGTGARKIPAPASVNDPVFSADGATIYFDAPATGQTDVYAIWRVGLDGSGLQQLTDSSASRFEPTVSPDGQAILFERRVGNNWDVMEMNADGSLERVVAALGQPTPPAPAMRTPCAPTGCVPVLPPPDPQSSAARPILAFDDSEKWRPLNVDRFLNETWSTGVPRHRVCNDDGCTALRGIASLRQYRDAPTWIDIGAETNRAVPILPPTPLDGPLSTTVYRSPNSACWQGAVLDCDTGPASAIYYHPFETTMYWYRDYWFFYRYNELSVDKHEGDWEGVVVAGRKSDPAAFEAVGYAQHANPLNWYHRDLLNCDAAETPCGSQAQRPWVYVAAGSQASYPDRCESDCIQDFDPTGPVESLTRYIEGDHGGQRPWGRNNDEIAPGSAIGTEAVQLMPPTGLWTSGGYGGNWVDWVGRWGDTDKGLPSDQLDLYHLSSPQSPAQQSSKRYGCPAQGHEPTACSAARVGHDASLSTCSNWFGADLVATVCSPRELRTSVRKGRLSRADAIRFAVRGRRGVRFASRGGVSQLLGRPLRAGDRLVISGRAPSDARLYVRGLGVRRIGGETFGSLGLAKGGSVTVTRSRTGAFRAVRRDGSAVVRLG